MADVANANAPAGGLGNFNFSLGQLADILKRAAIS